MANPRVSASDPQKLDKNPAYIDMKHIEAMLDVSYKSIVEWRRRAHHPFPAPSQKAGSKVLYNVRDVHLWAVEELNRKGLADLASQEGSHDVANASYERIRSANEEKARLDKARADNQEIKNRILLSEYVPTDIVADLLAKFSAMVTASLGSIPGTLKKKYSWLKAAQIEDIQETITRVQRDIAQVKIDIAAPAGAVDDGEDTDRT